MEMQRSRDQYYEDEEDLENSLEYDDAQQMNPKSKFYANVKWALQIVLQHRKLEKEPEANRFPKKSLNSIYNQIENVLANLYRLEYQDCLVEDNEDSQLSAEEQEMNELLSSGITYLLLAEIVLQESPPTIIVIIKLLH